MEDYLGGHEKCGIKVGDRVKIMRAAESFMGGWNLLWTNDMDGFIGMRGVVMGDCGTDGFSVIVDGNKNVGSWNFPYFVLEKVTRTEPVPSPIDHTSKYTLKDSGERETFESGMVRDTRVGKGRFDLISPIALRRLALIYEAGAIKYDPRNWEKGAPISRFIDSALRHINQFKEGKRDEDHIAQACWNLFCVLHFDEARPDLNDLPVYDI